MTPNSPTPKSSKAQTNKKSARKNDEREPSQASLLVALADEVELWRSGDDAYATIPVHGHRENFGVRSRPFKRWLSHQFFRSHGRTPNDQAMSEALCCLEGKALFDGAEHPVFVRVAERDGRIYLDLCNDHWEAVEVDADGWRVISHPPVKFRRAKGMLALPRPTRGGSLDDLRRLINVRDEEWVLVLGWLVGTLRYGGPFAILILMGEQGSAKTTTARILRRLIDPNEADVRCEPREPRDLMIAANNALLIVLDNLSALPAWLSDALCRLATGGGFSTRTLYENDEETIFNATRPTVLTSITDVATREDLLDRAILVSLPAIPEDRRRPEAELWAEFNVLQPGILGALLDAVVEALRRKDAVKLDRLPRMADFALWVTAAEPALGVEPGSFLRAYAGNQQAANETVVEFSPLAKAVLEFMADRQEHVDTPGRLYEALNQAEGYDQNRRPPKGWPGSAAVMSGQFKRLAPNLRKIGLDVEHGDRGRGRRKERIITIRKTDGISVPAVPIDHSMPWDTPSGDSGDGGNDSKPDPWDEWDVPAADGIDDFLAETQGNDGEKPGGGDPETTWVA